ncbi:MAG: SDR family NAD(P)-dependent oxidoreductase, partial [Candidatus Sericytochromatia bacterium]|nr:SDR family NAD(P)-dependent oxidoreductase [Candidatus Tanganyikabacteria bacterium]
MPLGTALVTGASSGIGEVFARRLAQRNWDVVLVARRLDRLEAIAAALTESYGIKATPLQADLVDPQAPEALKEKLGEAEIRVDYLVNNAGLGMGGAFISQPYQKIETTLQLNIAALTKLTYLFLPAMLERKRGFICNVASTGAFQPVPHFAVYAATKAYVLHFTEALAEELAGTGVTASCLCP